MGMFFMLKKNYLNVVSAYLKGDIEIFWEEGTLYVRKLK
jgi:hypothetical protein